MLSERETFEAWRMEKGVRTACPACSRGMLVYRQTPHILLAEEGHSPVDSAQGSVLRLALMRCDHCAYVMLFDVAAFTG